MPFSLGSNAFQDPSLPSGLVPFNVRDIGGNVYVTYAPAGRPAQTMLAPLGAGAVAIFDEDGNFIKELVVGSRLAAPWDITFAPPGFRRFSNHLLVGNFSYLHSEINAFDPTNGNLHGTIPIQTGGHPASGLWALDFGVGGNNGSPDVLYFTDGINGEAIDGKPLRSCRPCCHSATAQGTTFLARESERGGRREGDGVAVAALVVAARRLK